MSLFRDHYWPQTLRERTRIILIHKRCSNLINAISSLRGTWWGGEPRTLLCIYKGLIRGSMEYGCAFFPYNNNSTMSKLNSIQFKSLRLCLGLRRTTPTNVILAEAAEGPLIERFKLLTARYILKIFSLYSHTALNKLPELYWYTSRKKRKKTLVSPFYCLPCLEKCGNTKNTLQISTTLLLIQ